MPAHSEPYVGPRPFEEDDRGLFFGRDQEANELVSLITAHPIVLLYAQSGAGKTSLVKAALIPLLVNEEKFDVLPTLRVREQTATCAAPEKIQNIYMFNALMSATHSDDDQPGSEDDLGRLAQMSLPDFLQQRKNITDNTAFRPTVLVFDQFEELFTLYPERWEERQQFFEQIRDALADDSLLRVLFSMREDFIAELDPYAFCLPEKLRTRFRIERLNRRGALVAITQPLKAIAPTNGGRSFAPGVAEKLIDNLLTMEVKTPQGIKKVNGKFVEALQLQVVCQTLWNSLKPDDKLITQAHLETFGNVDTALSEFYEHAIEKTSLRTGVRTGVLRRWCEHTLITSAGTRAPVFRDEKETRGLKNEAVDELERQSLLRMELRGGARWYELTHDRFVEVIKQSNQKWLFALPGAKQILLRLEERATKWDEHNRKADDLLDEADLLEADRWRNSPDAGELELGPELEAFLTQSRAANDAKRQHEAEKRRRIEEQAKAANRFRLLSYALTILSVLALGASVFAIVQWKQANTLRVLAETKNNELQEARKNLHDIGGEVDVFKERQAILARSAKAVEAQSKLDSGDLPGAASEYNAILKENSQDPIEIATADWGLGKVEFKSRPPRYFKAIQHYDEALAALGYDAQGKRLPNVEIQPDLAAKVRDKAAFYLREKGELYLVWGGRLEDQHNSDAKNKYNNSMGFYRIAKGLGGLGLNEANEGFGKAKNAYDDFIKAKREQESAGTKRER